MKRALILCLFLCCLAVAHGAERPAVFAGSFYPGERAEITSTLKRLFEQTTASATVDASCDLIGLVVPHAGWIYSGATAAEGFKALSGQSFSSCIFIGVDHRTGLDSIGLWPEGHFSTPLGKIAVDTKLNRQLIEAGLIENKAQHEQEHSIEVLLPFFQYQWPKACAVFVSCGGRYHNGFKLGSILRKIIADLPGKTLIIISTDWSHYHDVETAKKLDNTGIERLLQLDATGLVSACRSGGTELCGLNGVISAIELFKDSEAKIQLLARSDSSVAANDRERVVGYAAVLLQTCKERLQIKGNEVKKEMSFEKEALIAVRKTLEAHLNNQPLPKLSFTDPRFSEKCGIFVTLKKHGDLRGCIGYIVGYEPLGQAIPSMAIAAATKDPRFNPVTAAELKDLHIEISVLSPMQDVKDINEIKIGRDGLLLQLGGHSGLLLPQVPVEWNWDREEFLENLCYKAGLPVGAHLRPEARLQRFSADVFGEE